MDSTDEAAVHAEDRSARRGPEVTIVAAASLAREMDHIADAVGDWLRDGIEPGPSSRRPSHCWCATASTESASWTGWRGGVTVRAVDRGGIPPGSPVAMTMHRATGMAFACVVLAGMHAGAIPAVLRDFDYSPEAAEDALLRERSLVYVAATRARDVLAVTWSGERSSLLPAG